MIKEKTITIEGKTITIKELRNRDWKSLYENFGKLLNFTKEKEGIVSSIDKLVSGQMSASECIQFIKTLETLHYLKDEAIKAATSITSGGVTKDEWTAINAFKAALTQAMSTEKKDSEDYIKALAERSFAGLAYDDFLDMYPSDVQEIWRVWKEVNSSFLSGIDLIGLKSVIENMKTIVAPALLRDFAKSLRR